MNTISRSAVDIELVGFNPRERTLLTSLFRVSELGPRAYREWKHETKPQPDCVLLDVDSGGLSADLNFAQADSLPGLIDQNRGGNPPVVVKVRRPFRWAEILRTLDKVVQPSHEPISGKPDSSADDGSGTVVRKARKLFKTVPAVLVVNPNPVGWRHISAKLASCGYRVDHVTSGAEALSLLGEHRYNGVFLETQLPDKDGFEICKQLNKSNDPRHIAAIMLTASRNPLDRIRGSLAGCDAFLSRPVDPKELNGILDKFLPDYTTEQC